MDSILKLLVIGIAVAIMHDLILFFIKKKKVVEHTYIFQDLSRYLLRRRETK